MKEVHQEKISSLRKKIASRLVAVKNETAMLTTFNEIDMSGILKLDLNLRISLNKNMRLI